MKKYYHNSMSQYPRLNSLINAKKNERRVIVKELQELVWHLYGKHKKNHEKLDKIRNVLGA